jgi:hypothetical protein
MSETRSRGNFEVVEHDDGAGGRLVQRQKQRMLALRGIRRAVHEGEPCLLQTPKGFALRRDIERLDRPKAIPAAGQRHDSGKIRSSFWDRAFELLCPAQPVRGIFDARRAGRVTPQRMRGAAGTKLKGSGTGREESSYFFQKPAAPQRKNPGRSFFGGSSGAIVFLDEALQLVFKRGICRSQVGFSDNLSELLSPFRSASAVSARF